ncbi:MAG: radical SAM protein [Planctomycetes bacterium]|nr:radical SAM protein [Planctomycetota bacterium]
MSSYFKLFNSGELAKRVSQAKEILKECTLCPRDCKTDRTKGNKGICKSGVDVVISSAGPHYGEEPPISGVKGSGTIFFTGCNMRCLFCQNYQISHLYEGKPITIDDLAKKMIHLQDLGCHNINLVTPTHFLPQVLEALSIACGQGLKIPIVYNTNGYDTVETLNLLDGIVDIYLPDIKHSDEESAKLCSGVSDYVKHNRPALKEMYRQVGNLTVDENGIAIRGLIIRHLVLPERLAGSFASLDFISKELSPDTCVGIMSQYHPCYKGETHPTLNRRITNREYEEVVDYAEKLGMENCLVQSLTSADNYLPDFKKEKPFSK